MYLGFNDFFMRHCRIIEKYICVEIIGYRGYTCNNEISDRKQERF